MSGGPFADFAHLGIGQILSPSLLLPSLGVEEVVTSCNVITDGCMQFKVMLLTACDYVQQGLKKAYPITLKAFVFSGGLTVLKVMHFLPCSPDACRNGRPMTLHVFFCQAEDGGQKGNSAVSEIAVVIRDHSSQCRLHLAWGVNLSGGETYARRQGVNLQWGPQVSVQRRERRKS